MTGEIPSGWAGKRFERTVAKKVNPVVQGYVWNQYTTAPSPAPYEGYSYFDTTAHRPAFYNGTGWEYINGSVNVKNFGALGDGSHDDTAAFLLFLAYCDANGAEGIIEDIYISDVEYTAANDLTLRCVGTITNRDGTSLADELIRLNGDGANKLFWRGGRINVNGGAFSGLNPYDWLHADIDLDEGWGITCTTSSTNSTSMIQVDKCVTSVIRFGDLHTMDKGTNTQGSLPRAVTIQSADSERNDSVIYGGTVRNAHGAFVIGDLYGGRVNIHGFKGKTLADNGVYNVGDAGAVVLHDCETDGADEPIVNSGSGVVIDIGGRHINQTNAIGLEDCGGIRLLGTYIAPAAGGQAVKLRVGNTSSAFLEMRDCTIRVQAEFPAFDFTTGELVKLIDDNNDIEVIHDSALSPTGYLMNWTTGDELQSTNSTWRLSDATADIPNGAQLINLPASLSVLSSWHSKLVNETANSSAYIRLNNARQQLMTFSNVRSIPNISAEVEGNYGALASSPPRMVRGTAIPTAGYWQRGSIIWNTDPAGWDAAGWICITAGTSGSWRMIPNFNVLSGSTSHSFAIVAAGAVSAEKDVTVTGVVAGDFVLSVGFTEILPANVSLQWRIKAADTVSVWIRNDGAGATAATATGTLRVRVGRA